MKRNEILGEHKKGVKAVKHNKKPANPSHVHAKAKEKLAPVKPMESRFHRPDAYERDQQAAEFGMDRGDDHRGLRQELEHETNNIAISINGKTWKVMPGKGYADSPEEWKYLQHMKNWAEKKSASSGKKWTVHLTGASVSETQGVAEGYPKHQDLSGISTDKLKAYLAKQSQQSVPGEGNQVKRVRAELQSREQGVAESSDQPASSKKFYTNKKQWQRDVDDVNHSVHNDESEYIGDTGRSTVTINSREWARWSDAQQKGYIDMGSMSEQGVAEAEGQVTASDPTKGVEVTDTKTGVKTTIPPKMASALAPDAQNKNLYTLNTQATTPGAEDQATGPKVGAEVKIPDTPTEEDMMTSPSTDSMSPIHGGGEDGTEHDEHSEIIHLLKKLAGMGMKEMDNGPVAVQAGGIRSDLGQMKKLSGL